MTRQQRAEVLVLGQIARDLVLRVDELPAAGEAAPVRERRELLGGKGANQAVGLAQLGVPVALLGVVGDDEVGASLVARAGADGIDVAQVVRRAGAETALIVDVVEPAGRWRYLEHLPPAVRLSVGDVTAAAAAFASVRCVVVQLQQPPAAALAAVTRAKEAGLLVVLDGAPAEDVREPLLAGADVLRMDAREARLLTGVELTDADEAMRLGRDIVDRHRLSLLALGVPGGDAFVWTDGARAFPHLATRVVDTTGAGDAMTAAITCVLCRGGGPEEAARTGVAAAAATVGHPGGRPDLRWACLRRLRTLAS